MLCNGVCEDTSEEEDARNTATSERREERMPYLTCKCRLPAAKNRNVTTSLPNMQVMSTRLPAILSTRLTVTNSGELAKAALRVSIGPAPP
jgi:hypothetical protein